jgi:hypothetical protein
LDLVTSTNAAFRPVDVEFGFDGALYVSDFSSAIIGHAQHPMRDARWNHVKGRICRVVNTAKPVVKDWPQIRGAKTTALLELLTHPQDIVRKHVRLELRRHGTGVLAGLESWVSAHAEDDQALLEAIFVAESFGEVRPAWLTRLMQAKSFHHRAAAVRMIRYQADRLPDVVTRLQAMILDVHPRVQMEVVDAVAHLRPRMPAVEHVLHGVGDAAPDVKRMVSDLKYGTKSVRGRSVPVLNVSQATRLPHWQWVGPDGLAAPVPFDAGVGGGAGPGAGVYRTWVKSEAAQPATLSVKHGFLDIAVNGEPLLSQDSQWSSHQEVQLALQPGLNLIELTFRQIGGRPPAVFLFDLVGQPLAGAQMAVAGAGLGAMAKEWAGLKASAGDALVVRAAPGLQFSPKELRAKAGSKVRLIFENPDLMTHNFVLVDDGAGDEVGALADRMASDPDGMAKGYVPQSPKILLSTPLVNPRAKHEVVFVVPTKPGRYPYLCTFPGHWRLMRGVLLVE